ncbi:MAG: hypothetical protein WA184_24820 [Stellaceae bacterium]|jgi:hypothetical protein
MTGANDNAVANAVRQLDESGNPVARRLRQILDALVAHRTAKADSETDDKIVPLHVALVLKPQPPHWIQQMEAAAKDGVEPSLCASIREEGWRAFAEGGLDAMHQLAGQACGDDGYLETIIDHHWDGIGTRSLGHWVC